jgi:hypothetical protein
MTAPIISAYSTCQVKIWFFVTNSAERFRFAFFRRWLSPAISRGSHPHREGG